MTNKTFTLTLTLDQLADVQMALQIAADHYRTEADAETRLGVHYDSDVARELSQQANTWDGLYKLLRSQAAQGAS